MRDEEEQSSSSKRSKFSSACEPPVRAGKTEFSTQREENRCTSPAAVRSAEEEKLCGETTSGESALREYLGFSNFALNSPQTTQVENQLEQLQHNNNNKNTNEE